MKRRFAINILCIPFLVLVVLLDCSKGSETYYPLKEGMTWEYHLSESFDGGSRTNNMILVVTNFAPRELKGKKVTPVKFNIEGNIVFNFIVEDSNGIYNFASQKPEAVEPEIAPTPEYLIKYPIRVGTTWDATTASVTLKSTIEKVDEVVTVSAGTFNGCVRVKGIDAIKKDLGDMRGIDNIKIEMYDWYAPGVGLIKQIRKLKRGGHSVENMMQLESFKK